MGICGSVLNSLTFYAYHFIVFFKLIQMHLKIAYTVTVFIKILFLVLYSCIMFIALLILVFLFRFKVE